MILNAKFTKFGQLSANEVTRYNIPNYLAFSHWDTLAGSDTATCNYGAFDNSGDGSPFCLGE